MAPSSERIVKPTCDLLTVRLSVTTVVLRTGKIAVMRCAERPQCGTKLAVLRQFSPSYFAENDEVQRRL